MAETKQNTLAELLSEARERLSQEVSAQCDHLLRLEQTLQEFRAQQKKLEEAIHSQLDGLAQFEPPAPPAAVASSEGALDKLLGSVRNLITATLPEQVLEVLTEEAEQMGVRSAVFDVRGKSAWGASARGFGSSLSDKTFRAIIVPLNQDNPFRQVYETGGHVDAGADSLRKNRNILDKLKPDPEEAILLLPIRSAGSVSAIFYADPGGTGKALPVDGLKILAEFAGAQLDRLMALSGVSTEAARPEPRVPEVEAEEGEVVEAEPAGQEAGAVAEAAETSAPASHPEPAPWAAEPPPPPPAPSGVEVSQLSEEEQKIHKDAKRFAKLLISEIELYNKAKVAEGRKNLDIYKRLKTDIERSRQTYAKRFGKTAVSQVDYFHEELVRTLAANDASLLGSDYPGPSV